VGALTKAISLPARQPGDRKAYTNVTYDLLRMVSPFMQYSAVHPLIVGMKWADGQ
jgi:hypothetical protein